MTKSSEPSWKEAERLLDCRLDRRMTYTIGENGEVWMDVRMTSCCSGCSDEGDYTAPERGPGCEECGYSGRSRTVWGLPLGPGGKIMSCQDETLASRA